MIVMELDEVKWKELTVEPRRSSAVPVGGAGSHIGSPGSGWHEDTERQPLGRMDRGSRRLDVARGREGACEQIH